MEKKGQGISITVIIIAAIALVVLVVLIVMFVGRLGIFAEKVEISADCADTCFTNTGGYKVYGQVFDGSCPADMSLRVGAYDDVSPGQSCCVDNLATADEC